MYVYLIEPVRRHGVVYRGVHGAAVGEEGDLRQRSESGGGAGAGAGLLRAAMAGALWIMTHLHAV